MPFVGDAAIDALDRMLDLVAETRSLDMERPATGPAIKAWMDAGGRDVPWTEVPDFVRAHFRDWARRLMDQYPRYLPGELEAGGFTMSQAELVLRELLARAQHSQACLMRFSTSAAATLPFVRLDDLADDLASSVSVPATSVRRLLEVLTLDLDRSPDPCLTPIVPVGKYVVPMSCLIAPGSPLRNLTSLLQLDPERFGDAGRALGRLGVDSVAETLARMAGATVATNVLLASPSGVRLGDLDVVVVDPSTRTMVVFEVLWQIGPDGAQEINRAVTKAQAKRDQVDRNRRHLMSGTGIARWPAGWPDVSDYAVRWYILTRDVLPVDTTRSDTIIRSHQMLAWMLRADASIADLIDLLDDPPTPPKELSELHSATMKFGRWTVEWTQVAI